MVTFMLFLGMANAYVMRTNMSVAIVAMVNHTAIMNNDEKDPITNECAATESNTNTSWHELENAKHSSSSSDGEFVWDSTLQGYLLSSFFYGYVLTQIPFGILAKRYGSKYFLGIGMLINSVFGLLVPISAQWGYYWLMLVRFIQGLGEVSTCLLTLACNFQPL
jgi:ACS family sodium-dependent inorganic phosphate cotransporter-like MFS transporter 5